MADGQIWRRAAGDHREDLLPVGEETRKDRPVACVTSRKASWADPRPLQLTALQDDQVQA
jgi:hypothetical protein